mgnify:CR=1 FL=1
MTLLMRDKAKYDEGRLNEIFSSVQESVYSAQRSAQKANMTLPEFEVAMEKAGYTIPKHF